MKERALRANLLLLKEGLWPPGPGPARGEELWVWGEVSVSATTQSCLINILPNFIQKHVHIRSILCTLKLIASNKMKNVCNKNIQYKKTINCNRLRC